jgi:two-component system alkaline phosphatase synthesis response regulator PhoP
MSENKKILVVDDDPDIIAQVSAVLGSEGYEILKAGGEVEAEEVLMTTRPDLVILDLMMEQADSGFVVAHNLKKIYPGTPVILLTAVTAAMRMSFDTQSPEAKSWLKMDRVMNKPIRPEQLKAEVRRLLGLPALTKSEEQHP